jgi:acetate kinase
MMERVAETKEGVIGLTGLVTDMRQVLTATHEDMRDVRATVTMLVRSDAAHEVAIESIRPRVERVERTVGIVKSVQR